MKSDKRNKNSGGRGNRQNGINTNEKDLEAGNTQQNNRQLLLLHKNGSNNNDQVEKTILEETLAQDKFGAAKMTYCFKGRWILLLSMSVTLIITAIILAMLTLPSLDNEDQCFDSKFPFQQTSYRLFSTKTAYSTAFNDLNNRSTHYDRGQQSVELPEIFSPKDSLESLDARLTASYSPQQQVPSGCKVRQLHYFGRHAARYPSSHEVNNINRLVNDVKLRVDLSKFQINHQNNISNNNNNNDVKQQMKPNTSAALNPTICLNPLAQYKQWSSFMTQDQGNELMDSGFEETAAIAQRLKAIYPEMFDSNRANIKLGTTQERRTAQTASVFLRFIDNLSLGACSFVGDQTTSTEYDQNIPSEASRLMNPKECYDHLLSKNYLEKLQFHKKCQNYHVENFPILHNLNLKEPNRTKAISQSVSKKLKLSHPDQLTTDETEALYNICRYETAFKGSSIWCNLFSDNDIKFYEYLSDVDDFFNQAYGHPDQMRSACPVTTELMKAFKAASRQNTGQVKPEAHFYFTHSEVIQKILAASVDMEQDPEYSPKNILANLNAGTTPKYRQWRTSLFTPFSANLAFTLYECPKSPQRPGDDYIEFNTANEDRFKVIASLNERPIKLDGCSDYVCDLSQLLDDGRINKEKRCKLDEICKKSITVT